MRIDLERSKDRWAPNITHVDLAIYIDGDHCGELSMNDEQFEFFSQVIARGLVSLEKEATPNGS